MFTRLEICCANTFVRFCPLSSLQTSTSPFDRRFPHCWKCTSSSDYSSPTRDVPPIECDPTGVSLTPDADGERDIISPRPRPRGCRQPPTASLVNRSVSTLSGKIVVLGVNDSVWWDQQSTSLAPAFEIWHSEIWPFFDFQDGGHPPHWIFKSWKF